MMQELSAPDEIKTGRQNHLGVTKYVWSCHFECNMHPYKGLILFLVLPLYQAAQSIGETAKNFQALPIFIPISHLP